MVEKAWEALGVPLNRDLDKVCLLLVDMMALLLSWKLRENVVAALI